MDFVFPVPPDGTERTTAVFTPLAGTGQMNVTVLSVPGNVAPVGKNTGNAIVPPFSPVIVPSTAVRAVAPPTVTEKPVIYQVILATAANVAVAVAALTFPLVASCCCIVLLHTQYEPFTAMLKSDVDAGVNAPVVIRPI